MLSVVAESPSSGERQESGKRFSLRGNCRKSRRGKPQKSHNLLSPHSAVAPRSFCHPGTALSLNAALTGCTGGSARYDACIGSIATKCTPKANAFVSAGNRTKKCVRQGNSVLFRSGLIRQPDFHQEAGRQNGFRPENRRKPAACGYRVQQADPRVLPFAPQARFYPLTTSVPG